MIKFPKQILVDIETQLKAEKARVSAQITDLTAQDPFSDTDRLVDNAATDTEANEEINHERYQAMLTELKEAHEQITAALLRIDKGTYGQCVNCGKLIDTDRLGAIPTATLCMDCEAKRKR